MISLERLDKQYKLIDDNKYIKNLIAQSDSRHNLISLEENKENWPQYDVNLDEKIIRIGMKYIAYGYNYYLNKEVNWRIIVEKGANLIYMASFANQFNSKIYYSLLAGITFFSAGQYSKAFVILKEMEMSDSISKMITSFLKKDFNELISQINYVMLKDKKGLEDRDIYNILLGKSFSNLVEFIFSGNEKHLEKSKEILKDLVELSEINEEPSLYWNFKFLFLIVERYHIESIWGLENTCDEFNGDEFNEAMRNFVFSSPPITELFQSQKKAIDKSVKSTGAVLCLPTSSGKTKIAEITILQTLLEDRNSKIIYIAPFRSLANEIEKSFAEAFLNLGFIVSCLYGNNSFNKIDRDILEESNVIIATPEKIKAIIRGDKSILKNLKLLIVDEGHIVGTGEREIINELLIEELKVNIRENNGKIVFLSAVLPNADVLSKWVTQNEDGLEKTLWRPASQRLGLMKWTGNNVDIVWSGEYTSYNKKFLQPFRKKGKQKEYPKNKKEGICYTAYKLSLNGSVLLFCPQKRSINSYAKDIYETFREKMGVMVWKNKKLFEKAKMIFTEAYGENSELFEYIKYGIFCHHGSLAKEVRIITEEILKEESPKIIVATSTLSQGVNLGVSYVIVSSVSYNQDSKMKYEEFWNTVGRAGRAFVDVEGKILYSIDGTNNYNNNLKTAMSYLNKKDFVDIKSGVLFIFRKLLKIAADSNIDFNYLLELISNDDYNKIDLDGSINYLFDYIDDTLLSLKYHYEIIRQNLEWEEEYFKKSLAFLQANTEDEKMKFMEFIKAKTRGLNRKIPDRNKWLSYISTGVSLSTTIYLDDKIQDIMELLTVYDEENISSLINLSKNLEKIINDFPSKQFQHKFNNEDINKIREFWLTGIAFNRIKLLVENAEEVCRDYFSFNIPWGINAISRRLYHLNCEKEANRVEKIGQLIEYGLPNSTALKIYIAGISSREASTELSEYIYIDDKEKIWKTKDKILDIYEHIKDNLSEKTNKWIEILASDKKTKKTINKINTFVFKNKDFRVEENILHVRGNAESIKLVSTDYSNQISVTSTEKLPFNSVLNNVGVYFKYDDKNSNWKMMNRNPWQEIKE